MPAVVQRRLHQERGFAATTGSPVPQPPMGVQGHVHHPAHGRRSPSPNVGGVPAGGLTGTAARPHGSARSTSPLHRLRAGGGPEEIFPRVRPGMLLRESSPPIKPGAAAAKAAQQQPEIVRQAMSPSVVEWRTR